MILSKIQGSFGIRILVMFFATDQIIPLLINNLLIHDPITPWKKVGINLPYLYVLSMTIVLVIGFHIITLDFGRLIRSRSQFLLALKIIFEYTIRVLVIVFLALSALFLFNDLSNYRYNANIGTSSSWMLMILATLKAIFVAYLFWYIIYLFNQEIGLKSGYPQNPRMTIWMKRQKKIANLAVLSMFFSVSGTMAVFTSLLYAILVNSVKVRRHLYSGIKIYNPFTAIFVALLAIVILFFTIAIGESIKRSIPVSDALEIVYLNGFRYFSWISERLSVWHYSATYLAENSSNDEILIESMWRIVFNAISYRFNNIIGIDVAAPEYQQLSHFHYFDLSSNPTLLGSGASPGIIGSSLYLFPLWIAPIFASLYLLIVVKLVDSAIRFRFTWIGAFIACLMLRAYFLDPSGILIIFNVPAIYFLSFVFFWMIFCFSQKHHYLIYRARKVE